VTEAAAPGPLADLKVLDLGSVVAGPAAGRHLADFGAEVIKVEPPGGDALRQLGWVRDGDEDSLFWKLIARGKRCVAIDLKSAAGAAALLDLASDADALIENMRPGKLEKLGLGPEQLHARNPRLVVVRVTGFGQTGPYAQHAGFATSAEAMSGYAALCGTPDGPPLLPPVALTDELTGVAAAFAALAAIHHARRTGEGQVIDINLLECTLQLMGPLPAAYEHLGYEQPRLGSGLPYSIPRGTYRCSDGAWVAISTTAETVAQRVLALLGVDADQRFVTARSRVEHRAELDSLMVDWMASRTSQAAIAEFRRVQAAIAPVYSMADVAADPHVRERGILETVDGVRMQRPIAQLSRTPTGVRWAGRALGADDEEILGRGETT
jgi:crotonobetainyl-CoA:carnitine CoA-transferase CaiB-like acyl-CoA transferase